MQRYSFQDFCKNELNFILKKYKNKFYSYIPSHSGDWRNPTLLSPVRLPACNNNNNNHSTHKSITEQTTTLKIKYTTYKKRLKETSDVFTQNLVDRMQYRFSIIPRSKTIPSGTFAVCVSPGTKTTNNLC